MRCSGEPKHNELIGLIAWGREELLRSGIEEGQEECERVLMKYLGCPRSDLFLKEHELDASGVREKFLAIIEKRRQRIPLAYLLKEAHFWKETLFVDERVLIPRPETEVLVERILETFDKKKGDPISFLDIGTGSGAIAIALLREYPGSKGTLLDISEEALEVARENLKLYGLEDRATLVKSDLFQALPAGEQWDLIVSNPPYLSEADLGGLQEELKSEPRIALDGGKDGLDFYRRIVAEARHHLRPGGRLALEVGAGQAGVSKWLQDAGYANIQRFRDYLGIERVILAFHL